MFVNYFRNATTETVDRIKVKEGTRLADIKEFKKLNFNNALVYVNGFQKDKNYILKANDVCTVRNFPESIWSLANGTFTQDLRKRTELIQQVALGKISQEEAENARAQIEIDAIKSVSERFVNHGADAEKMNEVVQTAIQPYVQQIEANNQILAPVQSETSKIEQVVQNINYNINSAKNVIKNPDVRGCKNGSQKNQPYPLVIGRSYFAPNYIGAPYSVPTGEFGERQTFHALYNLGYNNINVTDICLGLKKLATNVARQKNGAIVIDGEYSQSKYQIQLEVQNSDEVSIYPQKVIQRDINAQLQFPEGEGVSSYKHYDYSSPYPQKCQIEIGIEGLVGKNTAGEEDVGTVKVLVEYSTDGGLTYKKFGKIGSGEGITYDSSTGETIFSMKNYQAMRLVAEKSFTWNEVKNATNHVVEFRIQRTTQHIEANYIHDTVTLNAIRTWCYDPELSVNDFVAQRPMCEKDRVRTTRLGISITTDQLLYDFGELNCIVHALGRTCTEVNGYYVWSDELSETSNPASMALYTLQSPMLGHYAYTDSEIDLQSLGELYKFCDEYNIRNAQGQHVGIEANGVITRQQKLSDLIAKILKVGRAFRVYHDNKIAVFIDKPIPYTTLILNNQNVLSASNSKNFDELPSGINIGFTNEDNYSQSDNIYVDYADAPARTSIDYTTMKREYELQTNVEQIIKNGLYDLACMKLRPEDWNRKVTSEGCLAFIGAKIEIQDDTIAVGIGDGAEILDVIFDDEENPTSIVAIETDGHFDVTDVNKTYAVRIQQTHPINGIVFATKTVEISQAGVYHRFVFTEPISLDENIVPSVGDILSFGEHDKITYETICMGKTDNGDGSYDLALIPYDERIYTADSGDIPEFRSKVTIPSYFRPPIQQEQPTKQDLQDVKKSIEEGSSTLLPEVPVIFSVYADDKGVHIEWEKNGNELKDSIKNYIVFITASPADHWFYNTSDLKFDYIFSRGECYEAEQLSQWSVQVKAINIYGNESDYSSARTVDTSYYGTWKPLPPNVLQKDASEGGINFAWEEPLGVGARHLYGTFTYELKVYYDGTLRKTITTKDRSAFYSFDRTLDFYPEKPTVAGATVTLDKFTFDITARNESRYTGSSRNLLINYSNYKTWIPAKPNITYSRAEENLINFNWEDNSDCYGNNSYRLVLTKGSVQSTANVSERNCVYTFDRQTDGYPEVSDFANWNVVVTAINTSGKTNASVSVGIDTTNYLGWRPDTPSVTTRVSGRALTLSPINTDVRYGNIRYKISICNPLKDYDGSTFLYYKPTPTANYYASENNYKDPFQIGGYYVFDSPYTQTMPLTGQNATAWKKYSWKGDADDYNGGSSKLLVYEDTDPSSGHSPTTKTLVIDGVSQTVKYWYESTLQLNYATFEVEMPSPVDTEYRFKIKAYNEVADKDSLSAVDAVLSAVATQAYDVVKAGITENALAPDAVTMDKIAAGSITAQKILVESLGAISANLGIITDGSMVGSSSNYWYLSDEFDEQGHLLHRAGDFRVGGSNGSDYIQCTTADGVNYNISIHASKFEITAVGTIVKGEFFVCPTNATINPSTGEPNTYYAKIGANGLIVNGNVTIANQIIGTAHSVSWFQGRDEATLKKGWNDYAPILSQKTENGSWEIGVYLDNKLYVTYISDYNYNNQINSPVQVSFNPDGSINGNLHGSADLLGGASPSSSPTANTIGQRDQYGYFHSVIFHDEWQEENINDFSAPKLMFKGGNGDNYIRNTHPDNVTVGTSKKVTITGFGENGMTFQQTPDSFCGRSGWASYFIANYGNGSNYYHQMIAMPFWGVPQYQRMEGGVQGGWHSFWTDENLFPTRVILNYEVPDSNPLFGDVTVHLEVGKVYLCIAWVPTHDGMSGQGVHAYFACCDNDPVYHGKPVTEVYQFFGANGQFMYFRGSEFPTPPYSDDGQTLYLYFNPDMRTGKAIVVQIN